MNWRDVRRVLWDVLTVIVWIWAVLVAVLIVQSLLRDHPLVAGFADAPEDRGGRGATVVRLR